MKRLTTPIERREDMCTAKEFSNVTEEKLAFKCVRVLMIEKI
jgi:hypothetical protein